MLSLLLLWLLAVGGGQRPPEDPTLLVILQTPEKAGDAARLTYLEWATGRERWSTAIPLPHLPDGGLALACGADLWILLYSRAHGDRLISVDLAGGRERFRIAGRYMGTPRAEEATGMIFDQAGDGVVAINPVTGEELWRRRDLVPLPHYWATVGSRLVLMVDRDYRVLDPATGRDRWKLSSDNIGLQEYDDLLWPSGPVQIGLDPKTGEERRRLTPPQGGRSLGTAGGKAYFQRNDRLEAYGLSSGALLWSQPLEKDTLLDSPSEYRGHVLVYPNSSDKLLSFDAATGRRLCNIDFPRSSRSNTGAQTARVLRRWSDTGGKCGYKTLQFFDVTTGKSLWQGDADDEWYSTVRDEVYGLKGREVFRVNVDAGGPLWSTLLPEPPWAQLAGPGCTVVALGDRLLCLSSATGKALWETAMPQKSARGILGATPVR